MPLLNLNCGDLSRIPPGYLWVISCDVEQGHGSPVFASQKLTALKPLNRIGVANGEHFTTGR